ncbi:MAG: 2-oxoacid:ferredoxin oxidoreductase subunit beta [Candidatus Cloacimonadales bacterium]
MKQQKFSSKDPIAWCPGCGNFGILNAVKKALVKLELTPNQTLFVSGIGQAAKFPHYIGANCFNGLHGRALPVAAAAKMVNPELNVLVTTGDGDCYGEGGNHFIHNMRRNVDITLIVHNNQIYGLTKGQASPTTDPGFITKVQNQGVILNKFNSLAVSIANGCTFVARGFSKDIEDLADLIVEAVNHKGFSLLEVMQPCVSFNKVNTYDWYSERLYAVTEDKSYDPEDIQSAFMKALEWGERIPMGIIYRHQAQTYQQRMKSDKNPYRNQDNNDISKIFEDFL